MLRYWILSFSLLAVVVPDQLLAKPCTNCCREAIFKPKKCDSETGPRLDRHATENMGPHGYNYDGIPYYLDDGYNHYGGGSWW